MPSMTKEELEFFLKYFKKNSKQVTLKITKEMEDKALEDYNEYIKGNTFNISDKKTYSIYYIISNLAESEQIEFIKKNIDYIKDNDENIFLYDMEFPKPLSYYLTYKVIKEIKNIDENIFKKLINSNLENLFHGISHEDYIDFYTNYFNELNNVSNYKFINGISYHNKCNYDSLNLNNIKNISNICEDQKEYNKEFINLILLNYKDKINKFNKEELLSFILCIEDNDIFKNFLLENKIKFNEIFEKTNEDKLCSFFVECNSYKQQIIIDLFIDCIKKHDFKKIIYSLDKDIIVNLYNKYNFLFKTFNTKDFISLFIMKAIFDEDIKKILDNYNVDNIEDLLNTNYCTQIHKRNYIEPLKYMELKYRDNIKSDNKLEYIDTNTSIFSHKYLKNLKEINNMLKNNIISKEDTIYKKHLSIFTLYLKTNNIIFNLDNDTLREIDKLFYKIVNNLSITIVLEVENIEDIALYNRLNKFEFEPNEFSIKQIKKYNVKLHNELTKEYKTLSKDYKKLILKLMLLIGYNNTKKLLKIDNALNTLEHLAGNVDVKNIELDNNSNPILNAKIINILFNNKFNIEDIIKNKNNDIYNFFPRIFNEWEIIKYNKKDHSINTIIDFLRSADITLHPKYYRLDGLFKYIGCKNNIFKETLLLHDEILKRNDCTIPKIKGENSGYTYEVLDLKDMKGLALGNITNCCFTVLGNGYSCLKHAMTSKNGRIFVVKKDNQIVAHSWIWRNGNLLCFDNVEVDKGIETIDFLDLYIKAGNKFIEETYKHEGEDGIKNITIGFTTFDKKIINIDKYPCLISKSFNKVSDNLGNNKIFLDELPKPLEEVSYTDSKNVQYLICGNGKLDLKQSRYLYKDERSNIMHYKKENSYDEEYIKLMNKKINCLRYYNHFENSINILDVKEAYLNDDWYIIKYNDGVIEEYLNSIDSRGKIEFNNAKRSQNTNKILIKTT